MKIFFAFAGLAALGLAPVPAAALPLISELLYDAPGSDDGRVFVELWGASGASLDGLVLEGVNGANGSVGPSVALAGAIPADGLFVVADATGDGSTFVIGADQLAGFDFQNGPDSVVLRDAGSDTVLDALGYGEFGPGETFAGEGNPAPDASPGQSLARRFADLDTGDNAADFVLLDAPTPGSAPLQHTVPEPALTLLLGVSALGVIRRHPR